jgi:inner membrane protein
MAASNLEARGMVRRAAIAEGGPAVGALMVSPLPLNPFRRNVVMQRGDAYELGSFDWLARPHYRPARIVRRDTGLDAPAVRAAAAATRTGRIFLDWARFPVFDVVPATAGYEVLLADARYTLSGRARFGAVAINLPRALSSPPPRTPAQESP